MLFRCNLIALVGGGKNPRFFNILIFIIEKNVETSLLENCKCINYMDNICQFLLANDQIISLLAPFLLSQIKPKVSHE